LFLPRELDFPNHEVCGVDEAGRGPLAGPLSIALVCFPKNLLVKALQGEILNGIQDSKKLTEKKRLELYQQLFSLPIKIAHVFVPANFIDTMGISWCLQRGIQKLVQKSKISQPFLLIDGNYKFENKLEQPLNFYYESIVKGDQKILSISAASIIAKVKRDKYMLAIDSKYPNYKFAIHKGYGTALHIKLLQEFGLSKIHRKSFIRNIIKD